MIRGAAVLAAASVLACTPEPPAPPPPVPATVTGTFSNLRYVDEAGDLVGAEIVIDIGPDDEYRAVVTYAVGIPGPKVVAPVAFDAEGECERVTMKFGPPYDMHFTGCIGAKALVGAFRHANGTEERVYLVRKP